VPLDGSAASAVWKTPENESSIAGSADGSMVAFVRGRNDLFVRWLVNGRETHIARHDKNITGVGWSPDGAHIVFTAGGETIRHEQTPAYSGTKIIYTINENVPGKTFVVPVPAPAARAGVGPRANETTSGTARASGGGAPLALENVRPMALPAGGGSARPARSTSQP
jgi:Tol biopolymer transport system component